MEIDKSKLMKNAWEIAKNGFYNAAFRSFYNAAVRSIAFPGEQNFTEEAFFYGARLRRTMTVDFTIKDFFTEALKIAWNQAKKTEKKRIEKQLERAVKINKNDCRYCSSRRAAVKKKAKYHKKY